MWTFVAGFVAGGIVCVGGLFGFIGFLEAYHVKHNSEFLPAVKAMFLELFRLIAWGLKLTGKLEPEGTNPEVGDVIIFRSLKLRVESIDHYGKVLADGHPRADSGKIHLPSSKFLGRVWGDKQWRIKKRVPYENPETHWWKDRTVKELQIDKLSAPKKKAEPTCDFTFADVWNGSTIYSCEDTESGTL